MIVFQHALPDDLVGHLPLHVHEHLQHVIVGLAWEEDFAGVEFIDGACGAPQVYGVVVGEANN